MRVAFKVQHRVHHVFQHPRARQCAFFGDMADQDHGGATGFGQAGQVGGAFTHLGHRARGAGELVRIHGLNRVNHRHLWRLGLQGGDDFFQLGFGQHVHLAVVQAQTPRPQSHLRARLFTSDIQGVLAAALQTIQGLQQQGGLANARVAANQHHTALHHAAAQDAVQFILPGGGALHVLRFDGTQGHDGRGGGQARAFAVAVFAGAAVADHRLDQGVPSAAVGAFAQPFGAGAATVAAAEKGFVFGHARMIRLGLGRQCALFTFAKLFCQTTPPPPPRPPSA